MRLRLGPIFKLVAGILLYVLASPAVLAQGNNTENITATPIIEWEKHQDIDDRLQPLGDDLMGDRIDPHTGSIVFEHTDVNLPGNFALDVSIRRQRSQGLPYHSSVNVEFGDWELQVPRIETITAYNSRWRTEKNRCSEPFTHNFQAVTPPNFLSSVQLFGTTVTQDAPHTYAYQYSNGVNMDIPGYGSQQLLYAFDNEFVPHDADYSTKDGWHLKCSSIQASDGGESFTAYAPNGTVYEFTSHVEHRYKDQGFRAIHTAFYHRYKSVLSATKVTDVNGNEVTYDYTPDGRLTKIEASDGRVITVEYDPGSALIKRVKAGARQWIYDYGINEHTVDYWETSNGFSPGNDVLRTVTQPDGLSWQFDIDGMTAEPAPAEGCIGPWALLFIDHPYGARGTFALSEKRHRPSLELDTRSYEFCPVQNGHEGGVETAPFGALDTPPPRLLMVPTVSVTSKSIANEALGQAIGSWSYEYEEGFDALGSSANDPTNWTRVTDGTGRVTQYYHNWSNSENGGKLAKKEIYETEASQTPIETTFYNYEEEQSAGGTYFYSPNLSPSTDPRRPVRSKGQTVTRDGDSYTQSLEYNTNHHNTNYSHGRPVKFTVSSNVNTTPREYDVSYKHLSSPWITGLIESVHLNDRLMTNYAYDGLGRKTSQSVYGQLQGAFEYSTAIGEKGALKKVTNAINNSYQYEDYKRGIPQTIIRADGSVESQEIDFFGKATSQTDALGHKTGYTHDIMGRMTQIDPVGNFWAATNIDYDFPSSGGAIQTITKGQSKSTITYDSMFRPILERTQALDTGWSSYVNTEYDGLGRVTFKSQPSTNSSETKGVDTTYDGLGRVYDITENVAPYAKTRHRYYSSHRHRVYDPSNAFTQYYSYGYDGPGNTDYRAIYRYANGAYQQYTYLYQNQWGQLTRLRQWGSHDNQSVNKSQYFYYDSNQRLCRHYVPEHGATKYQYDDAGQMIAYAKGQGNSGCGTVPGSSDKVSQAYDDLGRPTLTNFQDSNTPDITRTYDDNGNVRSVNRGAGADAVNWTYVYNDMDMLTHEYLDVDNRNYDSTYNYNTSGFLTQKNQPNNRVINYTVDGLGRMKTVKNGAETLASNTSFHASGSLHQMTYGNGQNFAQILNNRLLPQQLLSYMGGIKAIDQNLSYDARGLVTSIIDGAVSGNNRTYAYDGLGYLKTASGPWGAGSYKYDSLGNLREKKLGARTVTLNYDNSKNRLSQSIDTGTSGTRTVAYDGRGNVTTLGNLAFVYDKSDQPVTVTGTANGIGSANGNYRYDGNMKRVHSIVNGKTIYNVYDAGGALTLIDKATEGKLTAYVQGPMGPLARITNTVNLQNGSLGPDDITYLHPDHLGSAQAGTKADGTIDWREQYTPFGEQLQNPAANDNLDGFTGHIKDKDTGLNYMQARYYDPVIGRFLSIDPVTFMDKPYPGQFNRYAYTWNDPINATDPDGEFLSHVAKFAYGAFVGGIAGSTSSSITSGPSGARSGGITGALVSGTASLAGVKSTKGLAFIGSVSGQIGGQVDANLTSGQPTTANLKIDIPVTAGAVAGASVTKPLAKFASTGKITPKPQAFPRPMHQPVRDAALGSPGTVAGGIVEGLGTGGGELIGAAVGNALEANGIPTNIQLTNETGNLDLDIVNSGR